MAASSAAEPREESESVCVLKTYSVYPTWMMSEQLENTWIITGEVMTSEHRRGESITPSQRNLAVVRIIYYSFQKWYYDFAVLLGNINFL